MPNMNLPEQWDHEEALLGYLAQQLTRGRLGLFLGAGISKFYGLPDWRELIDRLLLRNSEGKLLPGDDLAQKAAFVRARHYFNANERFNEDVKQALYQGVSLDFAQLRKSDLLAAIGSLVMASSRGSAARVFTLNFDDLLENYLEFHGFTTSVIWSDRHWAHSDDVVVYHPHGFLPLAGRQGSDRIVLGTFDFHEIMNSALWRPLLDTSLRTHTFLFIGLSGADMHLQSLLTGMKDKHAVSQDRTAFYAVRFAVGGARDEVGEILRPEGVHTHVLPTHEHLPEFLFKICQRARALRKE